MPVVAAVAALGEKDLFFRTAEMKIGENIGHFASAISFVPVNRGTPDIFRRFRIIVNGRRAAVHLIAVVVKHHELAVAESMPRQSGTEVIAHELHLLASRPHATVKALIRHRFVLHGESPNRTIPFFELFDETAVVLCPECAAFRLETTAVVHFAVRFHPCRRAPWREVETHVR